MENRENSGKGATRRRCENFAGQMPDSQQIRRQNNIKNKKNEARIAARPDMEISTHIFEYSYSLYIYIVMYGRLGKLIRLHRASTAGAFLIGVLLFD